MKQRQLTPQQRKLIDLDMQGANDIRIASELGIHEGTVRMKRAALKKGIAKGAYSDLPEFMSRDGDLFTEKTA